MKVLKLGIVGASGLVGQTILNVLKEENMINLFELYLITSDSSAGKNIVYDGKIYKYILLDKNCLNLKLDFVIFSAGDVISKLWAKDFAERGTYVIDNSNAFRREEETPLIVPEINIKKITKNNKIISNPNCSTIQLAIVLDKLLNLSQINKIIINSYQSVSGAVKDALDDLYYGSHKKFKVNIRDNIIAKIGEIEENDYCTEENKIIFETKKILNQEFSIYATAVRVPLDFCHGESVYIEFSQKVDILDIKNMLKCNYIVVSDEIIHNIDSKNKNLTFVFRVRKAGDNGIMLFIMADNLRRGAAYNAVMILKHLVNQTKNIN